MTLPHSSRPAPLHGSLVANDMGGDRLGARPAPVDYPMSDRDYVLMSIGVVALMGLFLMVMLSLFGPKGAPVVRTDLPMQTKRFVLSSFGQPSFFHVILRDAVTDELSRPIYVVRHCDGAAEGALDDAVRIGDEYTLTVQPYTLSDAPQTVRYAFGDLSKVFCKRPEPQIYF